MTYGSLFSGIGGLDRIAILTAALVAALGAQQRPVQAVPAVRITHCETRICPGTPVVFDCAEQRVYVPLGWGAR